MKNMKSEKNWLKKFVLKEKNNKINKMDNSNFGSSHLSSPALVVFSQAANGLSDALRLQRPFHSQLQDAKDLHHLSLVSSYGTHLLHGFQPHFLHQHLNPAVSSANSSPFGSGGAFVKPFPSNISLPSAFAPPKCLGFGLDQVSIWKLPLVLLCWIYLTDKSSPNSRACSLAPGIIHLLVMVREVNRSEQIRRVQHVLHCHHQQKMNQWKATPVKKVIVIESVVHREVQRHLALEVSETKLIYSLPRLYLHLQHLSDREHFFWTLQAHKLRVSFNGKSFSTFLFFLRANWCMDHTNECEWTEQHKTILELLVFRHVCSKRKVIKSLKAKFGETFSEMLKGFHFKSIFACFSKISLCGIASERKVFKPRII